MPDAALLARLAAAVEANFEQEVGFLGDLVRFPSTRGNEAPLQDWMARQLAARGYAVDRYTLADIVEITLRKMRRDKVSPPFISRAFNLDSVLKSLPSSSANSPKRSNER